MNAPFLSAELTESKALAQPPVSQPVHPSIRQPALAQSLLRSAPISGSILPHELPDALDRCEGVTVLSLDCFDTLIWRDCYKPTDLFSALPNVSEAQRRWAEASARRIAAFGHGRNDIGIAEIYAELFPTAPAAQRQVAIAAEIAVEIAHCYAFAPTVELMRRAKDRGMKILIVSDTYLNAAQLRLLIAGAAGEEVAGLIDRIFASSTYGKPKSAGLFAEVLKKLPVRPSQILHIGDNFHADVGGVARFGVNTLHLKQFDEALVRQFRQEASIDAMISPLTPIHADLPSPLSVSALQPHRAALALAAPLADDPAYRFGLSVLGPVMTGFERWLKAEAAALERLHEGTTRGKVHWLFMMRDGFLPMQVHRIGMENADNTDNADNAGHAVEISRVTAIASSFLREEDPLCYASRKTGLNPTLLARQLLFPEQDIADLIEGKDKLAASLVILGELRKGPRCRAINHASRAMASRLVEHIRRTVAPAPGDTLMLIDLGYNGTVQNHVDALLRRELSVHVAGRYLLLREAEQTGLDKAGMIDARHYDAKVLDALCNNIAVLEQLATTDMGSVIDYTDEGDPIRRKTGIGRSQNDTRARIQAGVLGFAANPAPMIRQDDSHDAALWRRGAAAALARLLYLPTSDELAVISRFEHDVNYGSESKVALFDPDEAARGLRERGLFYLKSSERMYLPAELSGHGLPSRLSLFASQIFDLPFNFGDFSDNSLNLPVIFVDSCNQEMTCETVKAQATHDGFFLAGIPVADGRLHVAAQLGRLAEWVEIESMTLIPSHDFLGCPALIDQQRLALTPLADGMYERAPHLWQLAGPESFLMFQPPRRTPGTKQMVALVFRVIVERGEADASCVARLGQAS